MKLISLILILLFLIVSPETSLAGGKETLVDISGVAVMVNEVSATARADGLLESDLKALVISKLEKSGITLFEDREWYSVFGGASLTPSSSTSSFTKQSFFSGRSSGGI